jgi:hypothetical protein
MIADARESFLLLLLLLLMRATLLPGRTIRPALRRAARRALLRHLPRFRRGAAVHRAAHAFTS